MPEKKQPKKNTKKQPKKRGRKPKPKTDKKDKPPPKKRGRKPKGGKIINKEQINTKIPSENKQNIILHLKCNSSNLDKDGCGIFSASSYNPEINEPSSYNLNSNSKMTNLNYQNIIHNSINKKVENKVIKVLEEKEEKNEDINIKEIWQKLEILKRNLKNNNISDKRSSCFWCTYNFDNPPIHIPKKYVNECYDVYGCFCSPECAVSYLKNENIDSSTLWERYALLNNIYGKIYDYSKNIKPAPSPYYTLEKYYGNLSIQEYRQLLKNENLLMIVDKPMTKILPELYEENNELPTVYNNLLNNTHKKSNKFRLKRKTNNNSKSELFQNNFGFSNV